MCICFRSLADDADAEAGAGERLALDKRFRQAKLAAEYTHLILEQHTERLYYLLEIHIVG